MGIEEVIGIDLGGTAIKLGRFDRQGGNRGRARRI